MNTSAKSHHCIELQAGQYKRISRRPVVRSVVLIRTSQVVPGDSIDHHAVIGMNPFLLSGHPEVARWFPFNNSKLFILIRGVTVVPERERVSIGRTRPCVCQESSGFTCKTDRNTKSPINTNDTPGIHFKYLARFIIRCIHCFPQIKTTSFYGHLVSTSVSTTLESERVAGIGGRRKCGASAGTTSCLGSGRPTQERSDVPSDQTTFCLHSTLGPLVLLHSTHPKHQQ